MSETKINPFSSIEQAVDHFRNGGIVMVSDDESRENECDLIMAAEFLTDEKMQFFLNYTTGIICATMEAERATQFGLRQMVKHNTDKLRTAFTLTIDSVDAGTGVSSENRCKTILSLTNDNGKPTDLVKPGHIFPLVSRHGGTTVRRGHTEASIDLCRLAGVKRIAVISELQREDGVMMLLPECIELSKKFNMPLITVDELAKTMTKYYQSHPDELIESDISKQYWIDNTNGSGVELAASTPIQLSLGGKLSENWVLDAYLDKSTGENHVLLKYGTIDTSKPVLIRVHSECFTGDVIHSLRCDCGEQLDASAKLIKKRGSGLILYLKGQEGRGIGFINKIKAYKLQQEKGLDTYQANRELGFPDDLRDYKSALDILHSLGITQLNLITNNPDKITAFADLVVTTTPLHIKPNIYNERYLQVKKKHIMYSNYKTPPVSLKWMETDTLTLRESLNIALVRTAWNDELVSEFVTNLTDVFSDYNVNNIDIYQVPGSFELPFFVKNLITNSSKSYDAILCVGLLFQGETKHFDLVSHFTTHGIMKDQLTLGVPIIDGVLSCYELQQAIKRVADDSLEVRSLPLSTIHMALVHKGWSPLLQKNN